MRTRFFIILFCYCFISFLSKAADKKPVLNKMSFEENKGQVHDQYGNARPDVLFKGNNGRFNYFFRRSGIIYQQSEVIGSEKKEPAINSPEIIIHENKEAIHRVELNWMNANSNTELIPSKSRTDYNNYYLSSEITHVKSYDELCYKELYNGIDVKWYQVNAKLKYDYLVNKGADYKQIKLQVLGYERLLVSRSGELVIETSLGKIIEEAPLVMQNGKKLEAKWVVENGYVSLDIKGVDPNYNFIIDPIVRDWGTYYGGTNWERVNGSTIDNAQNIFFSGMTESSNNIATVGAHQTTLTPTASGFLVKLDTNGVRLWGTYYAGNAGATFGKCAHNSNGDIFVPGNTSATLGISTPGTHQPSSGGGDETFLVKFNTNGVRIWATYYGGSNDDYCHYVELDLSDNIYMSGTTKSLNGIATVGSHLDTYAGSTDAFLVKFDPNGVRLWATYFGGTSGDYGGSCSSDALGNVYFSGSTASTGGISTPGCHQFTYGFGNGDGFLAKFNSNGVLQWGTYYGDNGIDDAAWCKTDPFGNILVFGSSTSSISISTPGSHQPINAGGADNYLAIFNTNGIRQWATYYGGSQHESTGHPLIDGAGNIYVTGFTNSPTNIATLTGYQSLYAGGGDDAFFAKFSNSGLLLWGSYYGDSNSDVGRTMVLDIHKKLYLFGESYSLIGISTPGCHQYIHGGTRDAFVAKFIDCPVMGLSSAVSNSFICSGTALNFSSSATTTMLINYNWFGPNSFTSSVQNPTIANTTVSESGTYSVTVKNTNSGCYETKTVAVIVNAIPTISINSGTICIGQIFTMTPSGASTYTFSNGSQTVNPVNNSTYSVTGTSTAGCISATPAISSLSVFPLPTVSITSTLSAPICNGSSATLTCNGASNYLWSNSATGTIINVSPSITTIYSVSGTDAVGCSNAAAQTVSVYPISNLSVSANPTLICKGQTASLSVSGAASYAWSNGGTGPNIIDSPTVTTTYTITGTDSNGCNNSAVLTLSVSDCTTINKIKNTENDLMIYPNPTKGSLFINSHATSSLQILNPLGSLVLSREITLGTNEIDLSLLSSGIYFVKVDSLIFKVIKE